MTDREFRYNLAKGMEHYTLDELEVAVDKLIEVAGAKFRFKNGSFVISMYGREAYGELRCVYALRNWIFEAVDEDAPSEVAA